MDAEPERLWGSGLWKIARMVGINIGRDYKGGVVRAMRIEGAKRSKRVHVT